jgi:multisubunit Na+/H+ antiporter MnhF subunit
MPDKDGREVERLVVANDRLWTIVIVLLALVAALVGRYAGFDVTDLVRLLVTAGR